MLLSIVSTEAMDWFIAMEAKLLWLLVFAHDSNYTDKHAKHYLYYVQVMIISIGPVSEYVCEVRRPSGHQLSRPSGSVVVLHVTEVYYSTAIILI